MLRCPNNGLARQTSKESARRNQLGRKFADIFDYLLDPGYYEGTPHGRHFNEINADGTSKIYVPDPLESELDAFCAIDEHSMKYLVGFTGMGKTTLLRNYFHVQDRDIHYNNGQLIIYISFYFSNLSADHPYQSVEDEVIKYLQLAIARLLQSFPATIENDTKFWDELYAYIEKNKPVILQNEDITPDLPLSTFFSHPSEKSSKEKIQQLKATCNRNKLEYYSNMLKFLVTKIDEIRTIFLIFDDIESKEAIFHRPVVELARHLHSCFTYASRNNTLIKTLVSLRAYTFRSNIDRQLEARREQIERNTIFKRVTVNLDDIFSARFNELKRISLKNEQARNKDSDDEAAKQIAIVSKQLETSFASAILDLANCNLCNAMIMYNKILVNVEWIAKNEQEYYGAFQVSAENYRLTAKTVFYALACGNEVGYSDERSNFFPNLLHNGKEEGAEIYNLLILRYLLKKNVIDLYGEKYVQWSEILQDISSVFIGLSDSDIAIERWQARLADSLSYLYDTGVLLRSIYDIESLDDDQVERKFSRTYKLYISPRGQFLFNMFSQNALLLELYRDSIYVDLKDNDKLTSTMRVNDVMHYLISYVTKLFEYEKHLIGDAQLNLLKYQEYFSSEYLVSPLLEGIVKNIRSYFKEDSDDYSLLMNEIHLLITRINQFTDLIINERNIAFHLSDYLIDVEL